MADVKKIAQKLIKDGPDKVEETPRRVRVWFDGVCIVDTTKARHVWEHPYYPQYWVPVHEIKGVGFTDGDYIDAGKMATLMTMKAPKGINQRSTERVLHFHEGPLKGLVRLPFEDMDTWFEEDTPIYQHPKDPYKRIDILPSSRKISIKIDGVLIAESTTNMFLFETMLRPRYYMPKTSVLDPKFIRESETTTSCPYKGLANYYNVLVNGKEYPDLIWWYKYPTPESTAIAGHVCFYNEKVQVYIDDVLEEIKRGS